MKIAVLAGGLSPERNVSLTSGSLIANTLSRKGYKVVLLDVYKDVEIPRKGISALFSENTSYSATVEEKEPDLDALRRTRKDTSLIGEGVLDVCRYADAVFLAMHGDMGENGQLQAALDCAGVRRYTGSGYDGSLLAMDKDISKKLFSFADVPTAPWLTITTPADADKVVERIGFPCFVKPISCGSSVGVTPVERKEDLYRALLSAFAYSEKVLIEKKISGREFSSGIIGGEVLPPIEIIPLSGFYDYKNKYQAGMTKEICPADLTDSQKKKLADYTKAAFSALNLSGYARIDFILSDDDEDFYCLEANTLPGMTPTSLLPQEAAAVGISYEELCIKLVKLALEK